MSDEWEDSLKDLIDPEAFGKIRNEINRKAEITKYYGIGILALSFLFLVLALWFLGFSSLIKLPLKDRIILLQGLYGAAIAVVGIFSPMRTGKLNRETINKLAGIKITNPDFDGMQRYLEKKSIRMEKWFSLMGGIGILCASLMGLLG